MAEQNILEAIRSAMDEELERDPNVMVLGEDVGKKGGVFGATEGLFAKYGEKRVLDTPLTEGMIAGAAAGAAIYGLRPIAEMQFADFVYPAFNQIVSEISRMRYRSNNAFGLPMVIRMPYGGGVHGALYHSQSNETYFTSTVGLKVVAPGTPADAKGLLKASVRDPDPVMFFEHKKTYRLFKAEVPDGDHVVPIGSAEVARSGYAGPVPLLSPDECAALRQHLDEPDLPAPLDWVKGRAATDRLIYDIATKPNLIALLCPHLGEEIVLWGAQIIRRGRGTRSTRR